MSVIFEMGKTKTFEILILTNFLSSLMKDGKSLSCWRRRLEWSLSRNRRGCGAGYLDWVQPWCGRFFEQVRMLAWSNAILSDLLMKMGQMPWSGPWEIALLPFKVFVKRATISNSQPIWPWRINWLEQTQLSYRDFEVLDTIAFVHPLYLHIKYVHLRGISGLKTKSTW